MKPLGIKNYGSIGHIPESRMGPGDHHCPPGQSAIATTKTRDKHDEVFCSEKLDGSNCGVCKVDGVIYPLSRSGYIATTSPYPQHHRFAEWVYYHQSRFNDLLQEGERIVGEWLIQAHGTRYNLPHEPFVVFDLFSPANQRSPYDDLVKRIQSFDLTIAALLHRGGAFSLEEALKEIENSRHGAIDPVEGVVWRVERKGKVDFLCKYVRPEKQDGLYLSEISGNPPVWNSFSGVDIWAKSTVFV
jgi:ATP-dependent RNA circularization protein (DNA/RNA ligase family)